jgi:hypothetical protein
MFNQNYEFLHYRNFIFLDKPKVAPTVESVKKTKASLKKTVMADVNNFQKYGDPKKFQKHLEDKFKVNTDQAKLKIMASASVQGALGSFLKSAKKSIPSILGRLKAVNPKAKETPKNLIKLRAKLEKVRKDMNTQLQTLRAQTKQLDKRIQGEKYRIGCDMIWQVQKSRKIICSPKGYEPHKYTLDLSQRKNLHKKVEGLLKSPAEKMMRPHEFNKLLRKEIGELEKSGDHRVKIMSSLDLAVVEVGMDGLALGSITKEESESRMSGLKNSEYYKKAIAELKGSNTELGDLTIKEVYKTPQNALVIFKKGLSKALSKVKEKMKLNRLTKAMDEGFKTRINEAKSKIPNFKLKYKTSVWLKYIKQTKEYKKLYQKSVKDVNNTDPNILRKVIEINFKYYLLAERIMEQNNKPPSIAACKYKDGKITVAGKGVGKMKLDSYRFVPKVNINTGSTVGKMGSVKVNAFNIKKILKAQLHGPFREGLRTHINQNQFTKRISKNLAEKIIAAVDFDKITQDMISRSFKMTIVGTASADGNFAYNKDLAKRRGEKARDTFITVNHLPKSFAKNIRIESHVEGPNGNEVKSQAEANKLHSQLKDMWNKGKPGKKVTEGQMRKYLSYYNNEQKVKLPNGMYDFMKDKIGSKRGVQYLSSFHSGDSAISFSSQESGPNS